MNTYIWKHEASDGVTELYAGQTGRTVEQRIKPIAYNGPKSRPLTAKQVEVIYQKKHQPDMWDDRHRWWSVDYHEQILIDTIEAIKQLYPDKIRVLNTNHGLSKAASLHRRSNFVEYRKKNTEGLPFSAQVMAEVIKDLFKNEFPDLAGDIWGRNYSASKPRIGMVWSNGERYTPRKEAFA